MCCIGTFFLLYIYLKFFILRSLDDKENLMIKKTIKSLADALPVSIINMESSLNFSRGEGLQRGVLSVPDDSLLFLTDVDLIFTYETIERIRLNTILGIQVYFPIIFSEYDKKFWLFATSSETNLNTTFKNKNLIYNDDRGYFRSFGFGIVSIFKNDFLKVGGYNFTIKGWGFEDIDFFQKCIKSNLQILRVPDPSIIHISHFMDCNSIELPSNQFKMCVDSKKSNLVSYKFLSHQILLNL